MVNRPLAFDIALIDDKMGRLDGRVGVELKHHARMAGAHDAVRDEPVVVGGIAEMTGQALCGTCRGLFGRVEPGCEVLAVAGARDVNAEPGRRTAVASLATDAVRYLKERAAPAR